MWIDVTWGAGGSTADTTLSLCETAMDVTGLDVLMHLTCTNVTVDMTRKVLQRCKETGLCKTFIPKPIDEALELIKDNEAAVKEYGIELAVQMSRELMDGGCPGLHLYTLNLEKTATAICEKLGLVNESLKHREYPFNRSTGTRGVESTRPIFWAQRAKSYVERTNNWNEFPDGRFGQRDAEMFKPASRTHSSEDLAKKLSDEWSFSDEA